MKYKIIIEQEALKDLQSIHHYISKQDSADKAKKFILELSSNIKSLDDMPYRCRKSYYNDDENIRDLIYKKYTIVFKVIENSVHILTIFRQSVF